MDGEWLCQDSKFKVHSKVYGNTFDVKDKFVYEMFYQQYMDDTESCTM